MIFFYLAKEWYPQPYCAIYDNDRGKAEVIKLHVSFLTFLLALTIVEALCTGQEYVILHNLYIINPTPFDWQSRYLAWARRYVRSTKKIKYSLPTSNFLC